MTHASLPVMVRSALRESIPPARSSCKSARMSSRVELGRATVVVRCLGDNEMQAPIQSTSRPLLVLCQAMRHPNAIQHQRIAAASRVRLSLDPQRAMMGSSR